MKNRNIAICIVICLMMCINLIPVYGMDTPIQPDIKTAAKAIAANGDIITDTDQPEIMPLTPPAGVKTMLTSNGYVKVTWNKVLNATGYEVYRCLKKNGEYKYHQTVKGTAYVDKMVYKGKAFYYKICAVNAENEALKSEMSESAIYCMKPAAPVIKTKNNNGNINISWKKVYGAQKYYVSRMNAKGTFVRIGVTDKLTFTDKKGLKNAFLKYKVRAVYTQEGITVKSNLSKTSKILSRYVNPNKKMVALTFDDGPSKHTKAIVDCLFKHNSAATFFVVGNRIDSYKKTVKHTYNMGCELANHSYSHPLLTDLTAEQVKSQVRKTDNKIKAITGKKTALIRVPYGGHDEMVRNAVGKPMIQWSDDTLDWKTRSKSATVKYVMNNVQDGDIILMHDIHEPTKNAALELIPKLKKKGYQIVTVSELAKYKGYKLKNGKSYSSFR